MKRLIICASATVTIIGLLLLVILLPLSVKIVANDEIALRYNQVSREFDRNQIPYTQGRYVLTPGDKLFKFKRVYQLESFETPNSVNCVSLDGLVLDLDVTYQYRLQSDNLIHMFSLLDENYIDTIRSQAKSAIRDGCGNWTSVDFYYSRQAVQDDMNNRVDKRLSTVFCDGGFLQLVNVRFDNDFMNSVQATQVAIQDITQAENERAQVNNRPTKLTHERLSFKHKQHYCSTNNMQKSLCKML
jgi:regulator of protease activity HflC (stomatin/prohibitin superfamily)